MLLGLSTGNAVGLALVAGIFVVFALLSALVIPRRWPQFPGEHLRWFIVGTLVLFVATLGAVEVFAKEPKEEAVAGETETEPAGTTTETTPTQPEPEVTGKEIFLTLGCGTCHTFSAAETTGSVGPNLDETLEGKDPALVRESIVNPDAEIAEGYSAGVMPASIGRSLSPQDLDRLVAFLTTSQ